MKELYVIGGQQRASRPVFADDENWYEYEKGILMHVNVATGEVQTCLEYVSPADARAPGDPVLFKAGTIENGRLYACTQTEVLVYDLPDFALAGYISLPLFNDVHHVRPTPDGNLLVANSGLEMVVAMTIDGEVLRLWNVLGEEPWARFSPEVDYRLGINLKPHRAHPNFVFYFDGEPWVTRFECRDAICLTRRHRHIDIGVERVHDGVLYNDSLYFTTVDGRLVVADGYSQQVREIINLNQMHGEHLLAGWCRGLLIDGDMAYVGFSRIRPTKFREALSWVRQGFAQSMPTHIACYDLSRRQLVAEINLETFGLNAVFSLFDARLAQCDAQTRSRGSVIRYGDGSPESGNSLSFLNRM